jgi:hypothetical protein
MNWNTSGQVVYVRNACATYTDFVPTLQVDTCCINKQSDPELTEAINSMFRWYQRAAKCYVSMSDFVARDAKQLTATDWEGFRDSRWFRRGWTLQELLAPEKVEFFDATGKLIGDKVSLVEWITLATGIPRGALDGSQPLHTFTVEDRLSWSQNRQTKREEDGAYSLLGIFDVSMPLIYGEGEDKAYHRLLYEVENSTQTGRLNQKYSQYLPSSGSRGREKASKKIADPAPETPAILPLEGTQGHSLGNEPPARPPKTPRSGDDARDVYELVSDVWTRQTWSDRYERFYTELYVEGT